MKLWQKVFWGTFLLFELLFNVSSFYLIEHHFNTNLAREIDRSLSEEWVLQSRIETDWGYLHQLDAWADSANNDANFFLRHNAHKYLNAFDSDFVSMEILDARGQTVFTDFADTVTAPRRELEVREGAERKYIIRDIGPRTYLFVASGLRLGDGELKLAYIRDISGIYGDRSTQIANFAKINVVIAVLLAIGLYGLIWVLTRPIRLLARSAQTIASGDYSQRVPVLAKDEIGLLSEDFNRMADAVEEKVQALEAAARNRQHFIHSLTHELKTPLTSIIGYADLLRTTKFDEAVFYKSLNYIHGEGKRLESLSFKLMDLFLAENGSPRMEIGEITEVFDTAGQMLQPRLERAGIELFVSVEPARLIMENHLIPILCSNLLDNAIQASPPESLIAFRGYVVEEDQYLIEVEDEGRGIAERDLPKVFEPFFMADQTRSRAHHGAGLGLSICAEIVRLHGGKIGIDSRLGRGTKITVALPRAYN